MNSAMFLNFLKGLKTPVKKNVSKESDLFGTKTVFTEVQRPLFDESQLIKLKLKWLEQNSSLENYEMIIYETDFKELSDPGKIDFFHDVILEEIMNGDTI